MPRGGKREGAGRKPIPEEDKIPLTTTTIVLETSQFETLKARSETEGSSLSSLIRDIIKQWLVGEGAL